LRHIPLFLLFGDAWGRQEAVVIAGVARLAEASEEMAENTTIPRAHALLNASFAFLWAMCDVSVCDVYYDFLCCQEMLGGVRKQAGLLGVANLAESREEMHENTTYVRTRDICFFECFVCASAGDVRFERLLRIASFSVLLGDSWRVRALPAVT
jgi:hypothetical protein